MILPSLSPRILYLDGVPDKPLGFITPLVSRDSIEALYSSHFFLQEHPAVVLDCRTLPEYFFNLLLKFLEEYQGPIIMVAADPVPPAVLSRFIFIEKYFTPQPGHLLHSRWQQNSRISRILLSKLLALYKIPLPNDYEESLT